MERESKYGLVPSKGFVNAGEIDDPRERVATTEDGMVLIGHGVVSQQNGPFTLAFRAHGIKGIIYLDTSVWSVVWGEKRG